jgi:23S rRNA pseudouridine955/2504/2580 synthase
MSETVRQFTVKPDDDGVRLDRWFKRNLPQVGFATVSRWARTGQIRVDGKRAAPEDRLSAGQVLRVPPGGEAKPAGKSPRLRRELSEEEVAEAEEMVLEQDRAAIVLNKPPGLATQGGSGTTRHVDGLLDAFCGKDDPRPRLVHRLDKDTSGVLLIARTPGSAAFFSKRFSGRSAQKIYWALVVGVPDIADGMIELPIAKQPGTGGEKMYVDEAGGQPARTRYRMIERAGNSAAWVELYPLTGRTHQLRVHMAAIGHPIVGDGKYGGQGAFLTGSISRKMHLHARRLIIDHPDGDRIDATAPLPEHFAASMEQLGFDQSLGDIEIAPPPRPDRETKKRAAKAHAKDFRKERRGERRKRGSAEKSPGKPASKAKPAASKLTARKPAAGKSAAPRKPAGGKPGTGKPAAARKPAGGKPGTGGKR